MLSAKTQLTSARKGIVTEAMKRVAEFENRDPEFIRAGVAKGTIVIPANIRHENLQPMGIGRCLKTKINANIGTSSLSSCINRELEKLLAAVKYGADTVMDLSTGDDLENTRRQIILHSTVPIGTVPIYELACQGGNDQEIDFSRENILSVIRSQAEQGVDYMTIHAGIRPEQIPAASRRKLRIVSRGGALIARYMVQNHCDNPFYN